jgi:hypothetical protein
MVYDPHHVAPSQNEGVVAALEYSISVDFANKKAEALGLDIVLPDDNTLQLDFDTEGQWDTFLAMRLPILLQYVAVLRVWWTESNSGNKHVYIKLKEPMNFLQRVAYQAALGSDPTRELLSLARVQIGQGETTMLFEKPDAVEIVIYATDGYQPQLTDGGHIVS